MCKCTPHVRTPFCGRPGCEWPPPIPPTYSKHEPNYVMQAHLVRAILEQWQAYSWTVQGFGMVRTKLADVGRIHIWDSRLAVPLVSTIHEHPWPLSSLVISGELLNQRFGHAGDYGLPYKRSRIATGEGGGLIGEPEDICILPSVHEAFGPGASYSQAPEELHRSIPQDGTVTLLSRPMGEPLQETWVYWPRGDEWVSAEPRPAKEFEVSRAVMLALNRWNGA